MKYLIVVCLFLSACASLVHDQNPPSIGEGSQRVESVICDRHDVGENGCVFPDGVLSGSLKIYGVNSGTIAIKGSGCGVNTSFAYAKSDNPWIDLPLKELIGSDRIVEDCVLDVYQRPNFPHQDKFPWPILGMMGTITLGTCPSGVDCSYVKKEINHDMDFGLWQITSPVGGQYLLRGCGNEVARGDYVAPFSFDLKALWPLGYPSSGNTGCLFVMGIRGGDGTKIKAYYKLWLMKDGHTPMASPSIVMNKKKKIEFVGDINTSIVIVDGDLIVGSSGTFLPSAEGNTLRFYSDVGRSLVVFIKDGKIQWVK
jgi:hypothetical protein